MGKNLTERQNRIQEQGQNVLDALQQLRRALQNYPAYFQGCDTTELLDQIHDAEYAFTGKIERDIINSNTETKYVASVIRAIIRDINYWSEQGNYPYGYTLTKEIKACMEDVIVQASVYEEIMNTSTRGERFCKAMERINREIRTYIDITYSLQNLSYVHGLEDVAEQLKNLRSTLIEAEENTALYARNLTAIRNNEETVNTLKATLNAIRETMFPSGNGNELNPILVEATSMENPTIKTNEQQKTQLKHCANTLQEGQSYFTHLYNEIMAELEQQD